MKPIWIIIALLVVAGTAIAVVKLIRQNDVQPVAATVDPYAEACGTRPVGDVGLSESEFDLAGLNIGDVAVGKLKVTNKPQLFQVLSASAKNAQVVDYLICVAGARGEVDKTDARQIDYLRRMLAYLQLNPTPADFERWQANNPFPQKTGKLEFPDLKDSEGRKVLSFTDELSLAIRLINSGNAAISVWLEGFPVNVFFASPSTGPWEIGPGKSMELTIVFTRAIPTKNSYEFNFKTPAERILAEIRIVRDSSVTPYRKLAAEIRANELSATPQSQKDILARELVRSRYPSIDVDVANIVAANALLEADLPDFAVAVLRNVGGRAAQSPEFQLALNEAYTRAGDPFRARKAKARYDALAKEQIDRIAALDNDDSGIWWPAMHGPPGTVYVINGDGKTLPVPAPGLEAIGQQKGIVRTVDLETRTLTFQDGTTFSVPEGLPIDLITPNSVVVVAYKTSTLKKKMLIGFAVQPND